MREYESHFAECKDEATARDASLVAQQEAKLHTRRELAATRAAEAAWSRTGSAAASGSLPQIASTGR